MSPRGNSPQVQAGKVPKQRTQNNSTHIDMTKTTTEKEDAQDSTGTRQHANVAAVKEGATDSTAHKAGKEFLTITNMATKEDAADSSAKLSALSRRGHQAVKEEASESITTNNDHDLYHYPYGRLLQHEDEQTSNTMEDT